MIKSSICIIGILRFITVSVDGSCTVSCSPNPCLNHGTCNSMCSFYTCVCTSEYTGTTCDTQIVSDSDSRLSLGLVIGIVLGCVFGATLIVSACVIMFLFIFKKKKRDKVTTFR